MNKGAIIFLVVVLATIVSSIWLSATDQSNEGLSELPWAATSFYPQPDSVDVPLDTNISISFGRPPPIANMTINPDVPIKERTFETIHVYGRRYIFHLAELLKPSTTYSVTMTFGQDPAPEGFAPLATRTWKFTTTD